MSVRTALLGLVLAGIGLALVLLVARPGGDDSAAKVSAAPAFLAHALGNPQPGAALERKPIPSLTTAVTMHGYSISTPTAALGLDSLNGSSASWQRFANGAARPTPFGQESVSFDRFKVEQFSTVTSHQGERTWRWKLGTDNLTPRLRADGSVALLLPNKNLGLRILPVAIFNEQGRNITPDGLRWSLRRSGAASYLQLRLDDSKLPVPYVIDPSATFGANVGTFATNNPGAGIGVTLTAAVPSGSLLIASAGENTPLTTGSWSASDNHSGSTNTYSVDAVASRTGGTGSRVAIIHSTITTALTTSDMVTVTAPVAGQRRVASLFYFTGITTTSPLDQTGANNQNNAAPTVSTTLATTQGDELVVGAFGQASNQTVSAPTCTATTSVSSGTAYDLEPFWKNVTAPTAVQTCSATYSGNAQWAGAIATYKVQTVDHFKVEASGGGNIGTQTAGTPFSIQVTAQDASNNTVTSFSGAGNTVNISSNRTCSSGCTTTGTFTNGVLTGYSVTLSQAGTLSTITATRTSGGAQTGLSNTFTVNAGALDHFKVEANGGGNIATQTAGSAFSIQVTAQDQFNNTVTSFSGAGNTVNITSNRTCSSGCTTSAAFVNGVLASHSVTLTQSGASSTITVTRTSGGAQTGTSNTFTVNASTLDHFKVEAQGGGNIPDQTAGDGFNIRVTAQDQFNNTVTSFNGAGNTVDITSNRACSGGCTTTSPFAVGVLLSHTVQLTESGSNSTVTATRTSGGSQFGTSNTFTVNPGALSFFRIEAAGGGSIGTQTAGTPFSIKVTAKDGNNNTVTFTGTVDITSNRTCSSGCTTTAAFTAGVLASHSVTLTESLFCCSTITATRTSGGSEFGISNPFAVDPAPLDHFKVEAAGGGNIGTQTAGSAFDIKVTAQDAFGNTVTSFNGAGNTVDITSNRACLSGCVTTGQFAGGVLSSHSVTLTGAGSGSTVIATRTSGGSQTGTSNTFTVNPSTMALFKIEAAGGGNIGTQTAGTPFNIKVTASDDFGNTVPSFTGTVDITSNRTCSSGCTTTAAFTAGVLASHSVTLTQSGANSHIMATATTGPGYNGFSQPFTVNPAGLDHFAVTNTSGGNIGTQTAGTPFSIEVTAQDQFGNTVTSFNGAGNTVDITSNRVCSSGCTTSAAFSNGVLASHSVTLTESGANSSITGTRTSGGAQTGTSNTFTVDPAGLNKFKVEANGGGNIGTQTAGSAFSIQVTAQDQFDNTVTSFSGAGNTVNITSNRSCSSGCTTTGTFTNGVLSGYSVTLTQSGTLSTVTATRTSGGAQTGTSNSFTVNPGTAASITISPSSATITAGGTQTYTAEAFDAYGNDRGDVTADTTFSITPDGICVGADCGSTTSGLHAVTGDYFGITDDAALTVDPATADAAQSTLTPVSSSITVGGDTQVLTVTAKDQFGNLTGAGGDIVTIVQDSGTGSIGSVTDNGDGTYTATVTSPNVAGSGVFKATLNGDPVKSGDAAQTLATVTYTADTADAAQSTLTPVSSSITVGGDTQVLTVTAKDQFGNLTGAGGDIVTIVQDSGTGSIGSVTDNGDGTYTATVTSPNVAGSGVFKATLNGDPVKSGDAAQTLATVTYTADTADAAQSTLTPVSSSITVGGDTQVLTVTAKDQFGNLTGAGGDIVTIVQDSGTGSIGSVTDNGDGTYTATVTSPNVAGSGVFKATLNGDPVKSGDAAQTLATVTYTADTADAAQSTLTPVSSSITVGGDTQVLTVTAKDQFGNLTGAGGDIVTIVQDSGTGSIGSVTDNGDGTYTATVTSPNVAGSGVFKATLNGDPVKSGDAAQTLATVTYTADTADAAQSTLTPVSSSITVGGDTQVLTVTAKDQFGNLTGAGGDIVTIVQDSGTGSIGSVTDNGDGTYTATVTSPNVAGSGVFKATLNGDPVKSGDAAQTLATVTYTADTADAAQSTLTPVSSSITVGGDTQVLTVTAKDQFGNLTGAGGDIVTIVQDSGTGSIGSVTDNGDGTYTATVTSPNVAGSGVFKATLNGDPVKSGDAAQTLATVTYTADTADAAQSTLTPVSSSITVGGDTQVLTVTAKDQFGNLTGAGGDIVTIVQDSGTGSIGSVTDNGDGTYTATVTSPNVAGSGVFKATLNGDPVKSGDAAQTLATVTYTADTADAAQSTLTPVSSSITVGGDTQVLTVTAKDQFGNLTGAGGDIVTIVQDSGTGSIGSVTDNGDGTYTATVTSPNVAGSGVFKATLNGDPVKSGDAAQTLATVTYLPAGLHHFAIDTIGQQQAGVGFSFHVTAQDASNNTVTSFTGTVHVTSTQAIAGGTFTSGNFVNGELTIPITLTAGSMSATVTATKTGGSETGTSNGFRVVEADGAGTLTVSPTFAPYNATGNTLAFTYTPAGGGMVNGVISIQVPADWSQASTLGTDPGFTKTSAGTVTVSPDGRTITVSISSRAENNPLTITYGAKSSGGPGAAAPASSGPETWFGKSKGAAGGSLQDLSSSPSVNVLAADGSGTISPSPNQVVKGTTGNTITFTYTAATAGMQNGAITLAVPAGWSAPSTVGTAAGYTTVSTGSVSVSGATINVNGVSLSTGQTLTLKYGDMGSGGSGATAPATAQVQTWTTKQRSSNAGTLTSLAVQPSVTILASPPPPDHFDIDPIGMQQAGVGFSFHVIARDSSGNIQTSYTGPGTGVTVNSNRTIQGGTFTSADFSSGQVTIPITLTDGGTDSTVTVTKSSVTKTSNTFRVLQADGAGSMTVSPTFVRNGSAGNTLTFVYSPVAGGIANGTVSIDVPAGWSDPSTVSSAAGYVTVSGGSVTIDGRTIVAAIVDRGAGNGLTIKYGAKTGTGPGATAPATGGSVPWTAKSKGAAGGTAQPLASSPSVNVLAADGSGSISPSTTSVANSSTGNTITFTYTADTGGMQNGTITLAVPTGWSAPSSVSGTAGYSTASTGSLSVSSRTITVSGITLNGGGTMTIKYGDTTGGGTGATAPSTASTQQWTTKQRSNSGGTLALLAVQPSITVTP